MPARPTDDVPSDCPWCGQRTPSPRPGEPLVFCPDRDCQALLEPRRYLAEVWKGRYHPLRLFEPGGFASVVHCKDSYLRRDVAVKIPKAWVSRSERWRPYFLREARALARFSDDCIVRVHDIRSDDLPRRWEQIPSFVMEYVSGPTLEELKDDPDLGPLTWLQIYLEVARALATAHQEVTAHGDLHPGNVFLVRRDPPGIKLADFGLVWPQSPDSLEGIPGAGRTPYRAPEVLSGEVDGRADLYSLGVMLYEAICGELRPDLRTVCPDRFEAEGLPPRLADTIRRLAWRDRGVRHTSAEQAVEALEACLTVARPWARVETPDPASWDRPAWCSIDAPSGTWAERLAPRQRVWCRVEVGLPAEHARALRGVFSAERIASVEAEIRPSEGRSRVDQRVLRALRPPARGIPTSPMEVRPQVRLLAVRQGDPWFVPVDLDVCRSDWRESVDIVLGQDFLEHVQVLEGERRVYLLPRPPPAART